MNHSTNPLLEAWELPPFESIRPQHAVPAIEQALRESRQALADLETLTEPGFDALALPLERIEERLERVFSPVAHLNAVTSSKAWREAHEQCLEALTTFHAELSQNAALFGHFQRLSASEELSQAAGARRKYVSDTLRDFRLAGVDLPKAEQDRARAVMQRLSSLGSRFEANVLDATEQWSKSLGEERELRGLPADVVNAARRRANQYGESGYRLALDGPTFSAVMSHAQNRTLRQEVYRAWMTRASDQADPRFDNTPVMEETLALRHELARLLGFDHYAALSLATKMAPGVTAVFDFAKQMLAHARPKAQADLRELNAYARQADGLEELAPWDLAFYSERVKQHRFGLGDAMLRPYFPLPQVLDGLLEVCRRLFGVHAQVSSEVETWHEDVRYFQILDSNQEVIAGFYLDAYARPAKRGGAWMDVCTSRTRVDGVKRQAVAYLTLNAAPPEGDRPALMTHEEVLTLFHEFGHGLHHMLTRVDLPSLSGIAGVEWDAVELPSQLLENWCWEQAALEGFARHEDTGEPLPESLFEQLKASRSFMSGLHLVRQLELTLFDFRLHADYDASRGASIQETLDSVRDEVAVMPVPEWNRFAHGFSHIFGGGYAAGYYSYLWAEVLAADAFGAFLESGVFDPETGTRLHQEIFAVGGTRPAGDSFIAFRGRDPKIGPLLELHGIAA